MLQQLKLADVIAKWQMELPLQGGSWQMLLLVLCMAVLGVSKS